MKPSIMFRNAISLSILSSWPLGFIGVWIYLRWRPGLDSEYIDTYATTGAFLTFVIALIAVLFLGVPLYLVGERRGWLQPLHFIAFGFLVALIAYCAIFWGIGGREPTEIAVQAFITSLIGGGASAVLILLAPPRK